MNWFHNANVTFLPFASDNNPGPTTAFVHSGSSLCRNLLQTHADSCFCLSKYRFVLFVHFHHCSVRLVRFPLVLPFAQGSPDGQSFSCHQLVKCLLAARGTVERQGSILGILVPNWQCWPLCRERGANNYLSGPFPKISEFPADGLVQHQLCSSVRNVFFSSSSLYLYVTYVMWRLISPNTAEYFLSLCLPPAVQSLCSSLLSALSIRLEKNT